MVPLLYHHCYSFYYHIAATPGGGLKVDTGRELKTRPQVPDFTEFTEENIVMADFLFKLFSTFQSFQNGLL